MQEPADQGEVVQSIVPLATPLADLNTIIQPTDSADVPTTSSTGDADAQQNRFLKLSPLPAMDCKPKQRRSRATTSRVLTDDIHIQSLETEMKEAEVKSVKSSKSRCISGKMNEKKIQNNKRENKAKESNSCSAVVKSDMKRKAATYKKKQTVRVDKGYAPSLPEKPKIAVASEELDTTPCSGCGELFCNSLEEWLDCRCCHNWFELSCAHMLGKSKREQDKFTCSDCC